MAVLGFANTIPFLIFGTVVIVAGTFIQRMFNRVKEVNPLLLNAYIALASLCLFDLYQKKTPPKRGSHSIITISSKSAASRG